MDIFTSNFASARRFDPARYCLVSISLYPPKGWDGYRCFSLAPSPSLLDYWHHGLINENGYTSCYLGYLDSIDVRSEFKVMAEWAKGRDIVLLCYEKAGAFCHRLILAQWVLEHYGYDIKEFSFK